jgi:outer membrane protein OmpA-like peptidoglycan-associated protein
VVLNELDQEKRLAFDQTAILAELRERADVVEGGSKVVSEEIAGRQPEGEDQVADTTQSHKQDAEVELVEEGVAATCEIAAQTDAPTDFRFTPMIADDEHKAEPDEPVEWVELTASRDLEIDEIASVSMAPDDDRPGPRGLLTDVDELLGREDGVTQDKHALWRWIFYPLVISLLLVALLVPKPSDLPTLWYALWRQGKDADVTQQNRGKEGGMQSRREIAGGDSAQESSDAASKPATPDRLPAEAGSTVGDRSVPEAAAGEAQKPSARPLDSEPVVERSSRGEPLIIEIDRPHPMIFDASGFELNVQSRQRLGRLAAWLQVNPTTMVVITGILKVGDQPMVQMRSALQRAELISARLVSEGISSSRIIIEGGHPDNMPAEAGACVRLKPMPDGENSKAVES